MSNSSQLRMQVSIWKEEDPDLFAILSQLDRGARNRKIRQMLRSAALIQKGIYVLAGSPIAEVDVQASSEPISLKAESPKTSSKTISVPAVVPAPVRKHRRLRRKAVTISKK